jgi:hypothetical protein
MKSQLYKAALLAALGLASVSAQAYTSGDLLVGVYQSGDANTTVVDLGSFSSLQNGEQWNLSSALSAAGITLTSSSLFGVVGFTGVGPTAYVTGAGAANVPNVESSAAGINGDLGNDIASIKLGTVNITSGNGLDWYTETVNPNGGANGGVYADSGDNVNATVGTADTLYTVVGNGSDPTALLNFNLTTGGELTYGTVAVPEPATYGLFAAAGLLIVSLRNKFSRKQA